MNIEICNYTKKLSKNLVLENINLSLSGGKIYGFVGKNGSGKTMLMRAICGLILPTSGFVKINNKIIGKNLICLTVYFIICIDSWSFTHILARLLCCCKRNFS